MIPCYLITRPKNYFSFPFPLQMKTDFKKMEDEMELLASNMESITSFSESISSILQVGLLFLSISGTFFCLHFFRRMFCFNNISYQCSINNLGSKEIMGQYHNIYIITAFVLFFQDSHHQISRLSGIHSLLKRLQFLFKLPSKLKTQMQYKNYSQVNLLEYLQQNNKVGLNLLFKLGLMDSHI